MDTLRRLASWIPYIPWPIRSLGSLIQGYTLPDLDDPTIRPLSSLTRVTINQLNSWRDKEQDYTFVPSSNQLALLAEDLYASLDLRQWVSPFRFERFWPHWARDRFGQPVPPVEDENQIDRSVLKLVDLIEWIIYEYGSEADSGSFGYQYRRGQSSLGILDIIWKYASQMLGVMQLDGPGGEDKVRGALNGVFGTLEHWHTVVGPISLGLDDINTLRSIRTVFRPVNGQSLENRRPAGVPPDFYRRTLSMLTQVCNEFEHNPTDDIIVQDRQRYLHFHRSEADPYRIQVSPVITNTGRHGREPSETVGITERPLGLWLSLIVGRERKAQRRVAAQAALAGQAVDGSLAHAGVIHQALAPTGQAVLRRSSRIATQSLPHTDMPDTSDDLDDLPALTDADSSSDDSIPSVNIKTGCLEFYQVGKTAIDIDATHCRDRHPLAGLGSGVLRGPLSDDRWPTLPVIASAVGVKEPGKTPRAIPTRVGETIGRGYVWTAIAIDAPDVGTSLVAKVFRPDNHPPYQSDVAASQDDGSRFAAQEQALYRGPLKPLQGICVPRWYGLYGGRLSVTGAWHPLTVPVWMAIMEDCGSESQWTPDDCPAILAAYERLHHAGVLHGDVAIRHLRRVGDKVYILDFDRGEWVPSDDHHRAERFRAEMEEVERLLYIHFQTPQ